MIRLGRICLGALFAMALLPLSTPLSEPDGEILFFEQLRPGTGQLMLLDVGTGKTTPVGRSGSRPDHYPSWSADGSKIAFESYRKGGWHVWVSDDDGKNARRLSDLPDFDTDSYEFDPSFAPNNRTVVYSLDDDLVSLELDARTPNRLTPKDNHVSEKAPVYSPDGKRIAFVGYPRSGVSIQIYTMNSDGTGMVRVTNGESRNMAPMWSPDGARLLFYSDRDGSFELFEMAPDGTDPRQVLSDDVKSRAGFKKVVFVDPFDNDWGATDQYRASYSPDGEWIAFSREVEGDRELFIVRRSGEDLRRVTHRPGLDGMPMWRPHGG